MAVVRSVGEVWRCGICGNVVEVKEVGGGELLCCGAPMTEVMEKRDHMTKESKTKRKRTHAL